MRLLLSLLCLLYVLPVGAEVRLPHVLSDHAVLQRDRPVHLWGSAAPGAQLLFRFHAQTAHATTDSLGKWNVWLAPESAGGPYTLTITGDGPETTLTDLLVGDVWFASGQSNMEMPLEGFHDAQGKPSAVVKDAEREIAAALNPRLRLLLVQHSTASFPQPDSEGTWTGCTPETARHFSAVAYFFGREIAAHQNVPVGLIDATWGGTPADAWTSMDAYGADPSLAPAFAHWAHFSDTLADVPALRAAEARDDAAAQAAGKPVPSHPWHPDPHSWAPAALFNGMVAPFTPLTIRGFLWYQGETNSAPERAPFYATLFPAMVRDWRTHFAQGDLPFLFVQISSFQSPLEDWGRVRDAQRRALSVANTAMVVTLDVGLAGNVHPPDKQTVGDRLARAARATVYGEEVAYMSPLLREVVPEQLPGGAEALRVWFAHGEGLSFHGRPATGFEVAAADHHWAPAQATVQGSSVLVSSTAVMHPVFVRFGWAGFVENNLFNSDGLPASTFTSESLSLP